MPTAARRPDGGADAGKGPRPVSRTHAPSVSGRCRPAGGGTGRAAPAANTTSGKWGASGRPSARAGRARTASSQERELPPPPSARPPAAARRPAADSPPTVRKPSRLAGAWPKRPSSCTASSARARLSSPRSVSRRWSSLRPAHSGPRGDASASSRSTASRSAAASGGRRGGRPGRCSPRARHGRHPARQEKGSAAGPFPRRRHHKRLPAGHCTHGPPPRPRDGGTAGRR